MSDALDHEAAVEQIVRAALRAIAEAGDQDALSPGSETAVAAVMTNLVADAATPIPMASRIKMIAEAHELIASFAAACTAETG